MSSFHPTHWSLVKRVSSPDPAVSKAALSDLYEEYRPPILRYLEFVTGVTATEAEDIFQDYFLDMERREVFDKASPALGRLRNFLLNDLNFFLKNRWRKEHRQKRGGGKIHFSLEDSPDVFAEDKPDPSAEFDRQWAIHVLSRAHTELEQSIRDQGKAEMFEAYAPFLAEREAPDHASIAARLNISVSHSRVLLSRLREKWTRSILAEVARTVDSSEWVEDEFLTLFSAFSPRKD